MRRRKIREVFYLNDVEHEHLMEVAGQSGLSKSDYLRLRVAGNIPKKAPPIDYFELIRQLRILGNNINQIARVANASGLTEGEMLRREVGNLIELEKIMHRAFAPEKEEYTLIENLHNYKHYFRNSCAIQIFKNGKNMFKK